MIGPFSRPSSPMEKTAISPYKEVNYSNAKIERTLHVYACTFFIVLVPLNKRMVSKMHFTGILCISGFESYQ